MGYRGGGGIERRALAGLALLSVDRDGRTVVGAGFLSSVCPKTNYSNKEQQVTPNSGKEDYKEFELNRRRQAVLSYFRPKNLQTSTIV